MLQTLLTLIVLNHCTVLCFYDTVSSFKWAMPQETACKYFYKQIHKILFISCDFFFNLCSCNIRNEACYAHKIIKVNSPHHEILHLTFTVITLVIKNVIRH